MRLRPFARERLLLVLVALAALPIVNPLNTQDTSRLALTRALLDDGTVRIDRYAALTRDKARKDGHWYTEKAPGLSFLATVPVAALRAVDRVTGNRERVHVWHREGHMWVIRFCTAGVFFLLAAWLVGRTAEGLRDGLGAPVAVTFALGTYVFPLATAMFGHVAAAAVTFGAFLLATRSRWLLAGLAAGAAVLIEYPAAFVAAPLLVYAALRGGRRAAAAYVAGGIPAAVALAAYNTVAFGAPWRMSYRYVANEYTEEQAQGFFGIGVPRADGLWFVFLDGRGILVLAPVLVAAAAGLVLLWRRGARAEAAVCGAVAALYLLANLGYFFPYGGDSPGPRFLTASLPFLAIGLAETFRRWRWPTAALALWSIAAMTFAALTWAVANTLRYDESPKTIWSVFGGLPRPVGVALLVAPVVAATAVAGFELVRGRGASATVTAWAPS